MAKANPLDRINYGGDLATLTAEISQAYQLGEVRRSKPITTGYEDLNIKLTTEKGNFLAKVLSSERTPEDAKRYADIIGVVTEAGINHPEPLISPQKGILYQQDGVSLMLFKFVEGKTFFELNRGPSAEERLEIIEQAAKINSIEYNPPFYDDSWSVTNIHTMFAKVEQFLVDNDKILLAEVLRRYDTVPTNLPHAFVHGDIITTNVVKGDDDKMYILDFSVANWYPRIQELAVIASSLLSGMNLSERCQLLVEDYEKFSSLQEVEKGSLYNYALAAVAMELIGAYHEKHLEGNGSAENNHWMELGRRELKQELGYLG